MRCLDGLRRLDGIDGIDGVRGSLRFCSDALKTSLHRRVFALCLCDVMRYVALQAQVSEWEEEAHRRLAEADEKQRAADRCGRDGANARRELERLKNAVGGSFEDLQRQAQ